MPVTAVVGANWGDEGKGKFVDHISESAHMVIRFQGGKNAGHTVINPYGKFALHLLPSGVFHPKVMNILGHGVAADLEAFLGELKMLRDRGVPEPPIRISDRAQVVLPYHSLFDQYEEERLGVNQFGSTRSGIAPFYADKSLKIGIQVADLYDADRLMGKLETVVAMKNILAAALYRMKAFAAPEIRDSLMALGRRIAPHVTDIGSMIRNALEQDKTLLLEGQLGALRDPDHGIHPMTTSTSTLAGFAAVGAGIPPYEIRRIIAVTKAYSTCVGAGPFVTELLDETGEQLREKGGDSGEYGATTGRPRRVGWFDAVATRYGCRVQGATEVGLTCLDVLSRFTEIKVCVAYEIEGHRICEFPPSVDLEKAKPVYESLPSWDEDIYGITAFDRLPANARRYVRYMEQAVGLPVTWISTGPERRRMIRRRGGE